MNSEAKKVLRQLKRLSQVAPTAESADRALARARATLSSMAAPPTPAHISDRKNLSRRSKPMFSRAIKLALICVILVAILLAYTLSSGRRQLAFAEVAEKVQKTQSLSFKTARVPRDPDDEMRILILPDGRMRNENSKIYSIQDIKRGKMILVWKESKKAQVYEGYSPPVHLPADFNVYELIKNIRKEAVKSLPDEKLNGRKTIVFRAEIKGLPLPEKETVWKVWVDPKTELPIRIEDTMHDEHGKPATSVMYDIEFDRPFDPAQFSFEPPKGYKVETSGTANFPDLPDKPDLRAPKIVPGVGLGPVRFGMSRDEIETLLGKPDDYSADKTKLGYMSRGFVLTVSHRSGLKNISCVSQELSMERVRDFAGKTKEGIGIGATLKDVETVFGKPDRDEGHDAVNKRLVYDKLGLEIQFVEDKVIVIDMNEIHTRPSAQANAANESPEKNPAAWRSLQINVVGPDDKPLADAKIHIGIWSPHPAKVNKNFKSDAHGETVIKFPRDFTILRFWAWCDGYVPLFVHWEEMDESPPESFTVKLAKGTTIGGTVQDEQGRPMAGAKIEVSVIHDPTDQLKRMCIASWLAEGDDARTTDAAGRWTLDNVPASDVRLSLKVSHPGYLDYASWDAVHLKETSSLPALRSQKATIILHPKK